jgi:hypothetical protein
MARQQCGYTCTLYFHCRPRNAETRWHSSRVRTMLIEVHVITAFSARRNPIRKLILIENGRNRLYYRQLEQSLHQLGCRRNTGNHPRFARLCSQVTSRRTRICEPGRVDFTDMISVAHPSAIKVTGYSLDYRDLFPGRDTDYCLSSNIQDGSGTR